MLRMDHSCLLFQLLGDDILHKGNWTGNEDQANAPPPPKFFAKN